MKRLSVILLMAVMAVACNKDDDSDDDPNPNSNTSSFTLQSADGSLNLSGTAVLNPNMGIDSLISVSMITDNQDANVSLSLFSTGDVWARNSFTLDDNTANASQTFLMSVILNGNSQNYISYRGIINITDKTEDEYIAGDMEVRLINPASGDSISTTGSFSAPRSF